MTITVYYSCRTCGLARVPCQVPARGDEDVIAWLNSIGPYLGASHASRSPKCATVTLQDLMIPTTGTTKVGGPPVH